MHIPQLDFCQDTYNKTRRKTNLSLSLINNQFNDEHIKEFINIIIDLDMKGTCCTEDAWPALKVNYKGEG